MEEKTEVQIETPPAPQNVTAAPAVEPLAQEALPPSGVGQAANANQAEPLQPATPPVEPIPEEAPPAPEPVKSQAEKSPQKQPRPSAKQPSSVPAGVVGIAIFVCIVLIGLAYYAYSQG